MSSNNNDFVIGKVYERIAEINCLLSGDFQIRSGQRILILEKSCYRVKILFNGTIYYDVDLTIQNWKKVNE